MIFIAHRTHTDYDDGFDALRLSSEFLLSLMERCAFIFRRPNTARRARLANDRPSQSLPCLTDWRMMTIPRFLLDALRIFALRYLPTRAIWRKAHAMSLAWRHCGIAFADAVIWQVVNLLHICLRAYTCASALFILDLFASLRSCRRYWRRSIHFIVAVT